MDVFRATMSSSTAHFGMIQGFRQELCRKKKMKPSSQFIMTGSIWHIMETHILQMDYCS